MHLRPRADMQGDLDLKEQGEQLREPVPFASVQRVKGFCLDVSWSHGGHSVTTAMSGQQDLGMPAGQARRTSLPSIIQFLACHHVPAGCILANAGRGIERRGHHSTASGVEPRNNVE